MFSFVKLVFGARPSTVTGALLPRCHCLLRYPVCSPICLESHGVDGGYTNCDCPRLQRVWGASTSINLISRTDFSTLSFKVGCPNTLKLSDPSPCARHCLATFPQSSRNTCRAPTTHRNIMLPEHMGHNTLYRVPRALFYGFIINRLVVLFSSVRSFPEVLSRLQMLNTCIPTFESMRVIISNLACSFRVIQGKKLLISNVPFSVLLRASLLKIFELGLRGNTQGVAILVNA